MDIQSRTWQRHTPRELQIRKLGKDRTLDILEIKIANQNLAKTRAACIKSGGTAVTYRRRGEGGLHGT
jgi:hypothetical protein